MEKPDLGPLFNVHSSLPSFIPERERRGGGRTRTSSQNPKLPGGTIRFDRTKNCLRINNNLFRRFLYRWHQQDPGGRAGHSRAPILTQQKLHFYFARGSWGNTSLSFVQVHPALRRFGLLPHLTAERSCRAWTFSFENKTLNFLKGQGKWCPFPSCILFSLLYDQFTETGCFKL